MTYKILAIDDHPHTLDIVLLTLQQHGFIAIGSNSPTKALPLAEAERPDLILLDMNMPEIDGKEVCRRLRAHPDFKDIPIIMFSAEAAEKLAGFEAGADDFLIKPTDPEELIARIAELLERHGKSALSVTAPVTAPYTNFDPAFTAVNGERSGHSGLLPSVDSARTFQLIGVLGARGGVGTTTVATNLAMSSAVIGHKTTLIDMDLLQAHIGRYLKANPNGGLNALANLPDHMLKEKVSDYTIPYGDNLELLLAEPNFAGRHAVPTPKQMAIIANSVTKDRQCVVADLGHEINDVNRTVLDGASQVIVVLRPERISLSAAREMLAYLNETLYPHTTLHTMMIDIEGGMKLPKTAIEKFLGYPLAEAFPSRPKHMVQAANKGLTFVQMFPDSQEAGIFRQLAEKLVKVSAE